MAPSVAAPGVPPEEGSTRFARALASNEKKTRDGALASLARWLRAREVVEDAELLKVWKGMFYALWHADKAPVQASTRPPPLHRLAISLSLTRATRLTLLRRWLQS